MAGALMIATVGDDTAPIRVGVRQDQVRRVILLHTPAYEHKARELREHLAPLRLDISLQVIDPHNMLQDTLERISAICQGEADRHEQIIINTASGDASLACSALSAAYVNGLDAIGVAGGSVYQFPVLRYSYQDLISDAKFRVLESLDGLGGTVQSLGDLAAAADVEKSLLSYHLRTTREGKGLEDLGLVQIDRGSFGRLTISLTERARMLLTVRHERQMTLNP